MSAKTLKKTPEFLKQSIVYQIFLRPFTLDGTLRAAQKMLPHIASLGVDIVYLCPINLADDDMNEEHWSNRQRQSKLQNPKNPYRMKDYFAIDPEYGTDDDLKAFVAEAHGLKIKVLLDLVYYHCGPTAAFNQDHPDFVKRDSEGRIKFGGWHFPELNFESPELREYLWRNMEYYIRDFNIDGYRCDVGGAVPIDFWNEGRRRIEAIRPDVIMISESWGDAETAQHKAFDVNYSSTSARILDVIRRRNTTETVRADWEKEHAGVLIQARYLHYIDNHDITNDDYEARPECGGKSRRVDAALAVIMALDGVPMIYNGQEIADGRKHSIFGNRRHGKNLVIDWSNAATPDGQERLRLLRDLIAFRRRHEALLNGEVVWLDHDQPQSVIAFARRTAQEQIMIVANLGVVSVDVTFTNPPANVGKTIHLDSGQYIFE